MLRVHLKINQRQQLPSATVLPRPFLNPSSSSFSGMLPSPELVAVPDYPVAAGQRVSLHCTSATTTSSVTWFWKRLENQNWTVVESGRDLTLTQPEQSGLYRCLVQTGLSQERVSPQHPVYIVSMHANGLSSVLICSISKPFIYEYTKCLVRRVYPVCAYMSRLNS